jgi:hypothetical protein
MLKAFRHILSALILLAPIFYGCETLAAQQSLAPTHAAPAPATTSTINSAHASTPDAQKSDAPVVADRTSETSEAAEADEAARTRGELLASSARAPRAGEFVKTFGYHAPSFMPEAEPQSSSQTGQGQTGQSGQQPSQGGTTGQSDPQQQQQPTPLTAGQKMKRSLRNAFLSPTPYIFSAFSATLTQAREKGLPDKEFEDEFGDWASRYARTFATRTTRSVFTNGVYASLFKQDPRYYRPTNKGFGYRVLYAASRVVLTRDDDGNEEPNYSRFAGSMTASALANIWERSTPDHDRIGTDATLRRFTLYFVYDAATNVLFREIVPTIFGR